MSGESEIREFLESRTRAHESKDIDAAMSFYAEDIVYYDAVAPLRFSGTEEVRANFLRWFDGYDGPIDLETHEQTIAVDGDVAFANMLHLDSGKHKGGIELSIWVRETVCLRRVEGRWVITHEHISIPMSPKTFQVWCASHKDAPADGGRTVFGLAARALVARFVPSGRKMADRSV